MRNHDAKTRYETTMPNHDTKPRYETTPTHLSLGRNSGLRIERYGGTAAYELCYPSEKTNARRAAEAFNKKLGLRAYVRGHGCLKKAD